MFQGVVVDVFKNYVKVQTHDGEKIVRLKGKRNLPDKGWILELKKSDPYAPFVGSVVVDSYSTLPPLKEAIPIIEETNSTEPYEITFFSELTRSIAKRLGFLPEWYYRSLGEYYKKGEGNTIGVVSDVTVKILKEKGIEFTKSKKKDNMKIFGAWLNTFSAPYKFRSYKNGNGRPVRIYARGTLAAYTVRIDAFTKEHGRVIVEGEITKTGAKLKVVPDKFIPQEMIESLRKKLEKVLGSAFIVQGGKGLGFYV